jgi:RNA polymerase-binding transcription factor DksA
MSLDDFKRNLEKVKELSSKYGLYKKEKEEIELDIKNLKAKYRENKVQREVFSEYNKKLEKVNGELDKLKEKVLGLCRKNSDIISDEMKNVI